MFAIFTGIGNLFSIRTIEVLPKYSDYDMTLFKIENCVIHGMECTLSILLYFVHLVIFHDSSVPQKYFQIT